MKSLNSFEFDYIWRSQVSYFRFILQFVIHSLARSDICIKSNDCNQVSLQQSVYVILFYRFYTFNKIVLFTWRCYSCPFTHKYWSLPFHLQVKQNETYKSFKYNTNLHTIS